MTEPTTPETTHGPHAMIRTLQVLLGALALSACATSPEPPSIDQTAPAPDPNIELVLLGRVQALQAALLEGSCHPQLVLEGGLAAIELGALVTDRESERVIAYPPGVIDDLQIGIAFDLSWALAMWSDRTLGDGVIGGNWRQGSDGGNYTQTTHMSSGVDSREFWFGDKTAIDAADVSGLARLLE